MKKVSIISLHLGYGGIEKSICALANMLSKKYEVEIACVYKLYDKPIYKLDDNVKIIYLTKNVPNRDEFKKSIKQKKFLKTFKEGLKSIKILYQRKKTVVNYIKNTNSDIIISTRDIFNKWLSKRENKSMVTIAWEHNHHQGNIKVANRLINSCKNLDYLVVPSIDLKAYYYPKLPNVKVVRIPNVIDSIPESTSKLKDKRLISIGRLSSEKGFDSLLEIYNKLKDKYPDWKLDIIGDGDQRDLLEKYIRDNKLKKYIKLHGYQNKEYIDKILDKTSISLMTSYTESFGIVLIEAMSHGIPCISFTSAQGANEIIENGKNGYLIDNRDYEKYIQKIEELIEDYELRKKMGTYAKASIEKYKIKNVEKLWFNILE